jgi:5-methylcytosine-specific restriction endonuclease McrA
VSDIPLRTRRAIAERSNRICELCASAEAVQIHHRKNRSQGGRHDPINLLHLCVPCHEHIGANPAKSYALGWLVHGWADPADVPIVKGVPA